MKTFISVGLWIVTFVVMSFLILVVMTFFGEVVGILSSFPIGYGAGTVRAIIKNETGF